MAFLSHVFTILIIGAVGVGYTNVVIGWLQGSADKNKSVARLFSFCTFAGFALLYYVFGHTEWMPVADVNELNCIREKLFTNEELRVKWVHSANAWCVQGKDGQWYPFVYPREED